MINLVINFFIKAFKNPRQGAWVFLLIAVNFLIPFFYLGTFEGKLVLGSFIISFLIGLFFFRARGYTRLLGVMHFPWAPLIVLLLVKLPQYPISDFFGLWIRGVILFNNISLMYDIMDILKYVAGGREELR